MPLLFTFLVVYTATSAFDVLVKRWIIFISTVSYEFFSHNKEMIFWQRLSE